MKARQIVHPRAANIVFCLKSIFGADWGSVVNNGRKCGGCRSKKCCTGCELKHFIWGRARGLWRALPWGCNEMGCGVWRFVSRLFIAHHFLSRDPLLVTGKVHWVHCNMSRVGEQGALSPASRLPQTGVETRFLGDGYVAVSFHFPSDSKTDLKRAD